MAHTKRALCRECNRPVATCICALVCTLNTEVELLILQHPEEVNNAKNSVNLLQLCASNSRVIIGEVFDQKLLSGQINLHNKQALLLYPDTPEEKSLGLISPPPLPELRGLQCTQLRLVIIDATWRKSRKMLYLNSALQAIPRLALNNPPASNYKIRKAHSKNQLSTLEASCYALQQLEPNIDINPLLMAFNQFVAQQASFLPHLRDNEDL